MKDASKIKLFIDAHCFDKEHQGTRAFIKRLYAELSKKNKNIEFYFGAKDIENLKQELKDIEGCKFIRYRSSATVSRLLFEIPFIIKKYKIDVGHFQYIIPLIKNCKCIVTTHDVLFNDFKNEFSFFYKLTRNFLFGYSLRNSEIITTVSEYSKKSIQKHFNIEPERIHVTLNGVSEDFLTDFDRTQSKKYIRDHFDISKYILYVSRFEPRKNHALLLKTYLDLQLYKKGYHLVLLGHLSIPVPEFDKLMTQIPPEMQEFVFISNAINDEDLFHFYRATEVMVYPSKAEGFGLPPIEAAALKIPVICSNTTAMSDYTFFGEYHIDPNDAALFSGKIEKILSEPPKEELLQEIREKIELNYLFKKSAEILHQAIQNTCL